MLLLMKFQLKMKGETSNKFVNKLAVFFGLFAIFMEEIIQI